MDKILKIAEYPIRGPSQGALELEVCKQHSEAQCPHTCSSLVIANIFHVTNW